MAAQTVLSLTWAFFVMGFVLICTEIVLPEITSRGLAKLSAVKLNIITTVISVKAIIITVFSQTMRKSCTIWLVQCNNHTTRPEELQIRSSNVPEMCLFYLLHYHSLHLSVV